MRSINVGNIDGIGECELREPTIGDLRPHMQLMSDDTSAFMMEVLNVTMYCNGERIENALEKIPFSNLTVLMPKVTELLGFGDDEGNDSAG